MTNTEILEIRFYYFRDYVYFICSFYHMCVCMCVLIGTIFSIILLFTLSINYDE